MVNEKIKVTFDSPYFIVVQTSDEKYLVTDSGGRSRVAIDGKELLQIIKEIFSLKEEK